MLFTSESRLFLVTDVISTCTFISILVNAHPSVFRRVDMAANTSHNMDHVLLPIYVLTVTMKLFFSQIFTVFSKPQSTMLILAVVSALKTFFAYSDQQHNYIYVYDFSIQNYYPVSPYDCSHHVNQNCPGLLIIIRQ